MVVAYWLTFAPFVVASRVRVLTRVIFRHIFNFSIIIIPNTKTLYGIYFQTDKKEEIFKHVEIRNYLIFHLISVMVLLIGLMDTCCN